MGKTYARSFSDSHTLSTDDIIILEQAEQTAEKLRQEGYTRVYTAPDSFIREANLILLATKPQDRSSLYAAIKEYVHEQQLLLSIMAGVKMVDIIQALGISKVVRAMPNLPVQIGMGITGFTASAGVSKEELFEVQNLLNMTGKSIYFEDEAKLDAVTAVSGSGPAYVFYFIETMVNAARNLGFSRGEAELLVEQTFAGALHLLYAENTSCSEWIAKVASKGGTTEAAMKMFGEMNVSKGIEEGIRQAHRRAMELGS